MDEKELRRIERLEAEVLALRQLVLSHIVASDSLTDDGLALATVEQAAIQRDAAIAKRYLAGVLLNDMIVAIRKVCDLPPEP